ncbi:MAG: DUF4160 domain-containing protein [Candidatus Riflebacteria bacterium]|nr:DUF4160 domain-containing protein [Candidatus Riflebacteria bacterium]
MQRGTDWRIRVNGNEIHPLPHVHVEFRDGSRVSVAIETREILVGSVLPAKRLLQSIDWIAAHVDDCLAEYRRLNP